MNVKFSSYSERISTGEDDFDKVVKGVRISGRGRFYFIIDFRFYCVFNFGIKIVLLVFVF